MHIDKEGSGKCGTEDCSQCASLVVGLERVVALLYGEDGIGSYIEWECAILGICRILKIENKAKTQGKFSFSPRFPQFIQFPTPQSNPFSYGSMVVQPFPLTS